MLRVLRACLLPEFHAEACCAPMSQFFRIIEDPGFYGLVVGTQAYRSAMERVLREIESERVVLNSCHDAHIVAFKGMCFTAGARREPKCLLMELGDCDLQAFLVRSSSTPAGPVAVPVPVVLRIATHVLMGLRYLHTGFREPVVHRDLKLKNLLVFMADGLPTVKIADVGLARPASRLPHTQVGGTALYNAPEVCDALWRADPTAAGAAAEAARARPVVDVGPWSDMYSVAVLLLEIVYRYCLPVDMERPSFSVAQQVPAILATVRPLLTAHMPSFMTCLERCVTLPYNERPTAQAMLDSLVPPPPPPVVPVRPCFERLCVRVRLAICLPYVACFVCAAGMVAPDTWPEPCRRV